MSSRNAKSNLNPWSKTIRHVGMLWGTLVGWLFSWILVSESDTGDDLEAGIIASAVGAIIGILYVSCKSVYDFIVDQFTPPKSSDQNVEEENSLLPEENVNNPWNARLKAGVVFGEGIGRVVFSILPIPLAEKPLMLLGGAVGGVIGGIIALFIPWWKPSSHSHIPQANPISERIRSGAMFGSAIGIVFGVFVIASLTPFSIPLCLIFGAGLGATLGSLFAYNVEDEKKTDAENSKIPSNPWAKRIRAGIQWGACLGILLGVLLPGLGIGLTLGLSVIVGGALFSITGGLISLAIEPLVTKISIGLAGKDYETANPWGPRCRFGVALGTSIGMFIGCFLLPGPIGALAGGAIGGLIGGLIAVVGEPLYLAFRGYYSSTFPQEKASIEKEDLVCTSGNQYSERCRTGVLVGAALGALIGFLIVPGLGMYFGAGIGGILGAVVALCIRSPEDSKSAVSDGYIPLKDLTDAGPENNNKFNRNGQYTYSPLSSNSRSSTDWLGETDADLTPTGKSTQFADLPSQ